MIVCSLTVFFFITSLAYIGKLLVFYEHGCAYISSVIHSHPKCGFDGIVLLTGKNIVFPTLFELPSGLVVKAFTL